MAATEEAQQDTQNRERNVGRIEEIQGVVVEAVFPDELPPINNALIVKRKTEEILQRGYGLRRTEVAECLQIAARAELDVRRLVVDVNSPSVERAP